MTAQTWVRMVMAHLDQLWAELADHIKCVERQDSVRHGVDA
jgi:hypothetical protein